MNTELEAHIQQALPSALKMVLYASKKQQLELRKYAIEGIDSLCNNAKFIKELEEQELLQELDETAKEFAVLETRLAHYRAHLDSLEPLVESGLLEQKNIDELLQESLLTPRINAAKHEFYKKFCDNAGIELAMDGDEDMHIQESESTRSTICPVTQGEMEDPLRNPSCGHTYSKKGIQAHFRRNKKCPVAGCPEKLLLHSLERDVEMEVIIARSRSASEQQRSQAFVPARQEEEDDEEEYLVE